MNFKNPFASEPLSATTDANPNPMPSDPMSAAPTAADGNAAEMAALTAERDQLLQEKADLNDRLLRNRAEFDNYRRRTDREKQEYFEYAGMETIKQLLPVVDDFERALKMTAQTRPDEAATEFYKGNELIYGRLLDLLKKLGLEPIPTIGTTFDPNLHEAIERVHTTDAEDQTILGEFQRGYRFKNRLLRPAMVKVAVAH